MTAPVTLMVIAKSPRPGRVKTRLCPPCTHDQAAELARAALADTLDVLAAVPARRHVLALDGPPGSWLPKTFDVVPQSGDGLAARLASAFAATSGPAFLVGMDTPQLDTPTVTTAVAQLMEPDVDAVLGPALDGGWWGIGFRRSDPRAFEGVTMSTDKTHDLQCRRLRWLGLRTRALEPMRDVDDFDDALSVAAVAPHTRFAQAVAAVASRFEARAGRR